MSGLYVSIGLLIQTSLFLQPFDSPVLLFLCFASWSLLFGSFLGSQSFLLPVCKMALTLHVILRESEEHQCCQQEVTFGLDATDKVVVVGWILIEEV